MKVLIGLLVAVAVAWGSVPAAAQCWGDNNGSSGGGKKGPGIGDVPIDWRNAEDKKPATDIVLKYYWKNIETKPTGLKAALEKLKTVVKVDLPADTKTAVVSYNGKCDKLGSLETAAQNAGFEALVLNHAHVVATLKPLKGADVKGATDEIKLVEGVAGVTSGPSGLELHADLEKLTMENLKAAVARFNCEIIVNQTFEYVRYAVTQGEAWEYINAADLVKGVMVAREDEAGVVGMWINKAQVKLEKLEKLEGFKVERK